MGCPVCAGLFPPLARRAGLDGAQVDEALHGGDEALPPEVAAAADWAQAVLLADGADPVDLPPAALTPAQRDHIATVVRIEMGVHAVGLSFLPQALVERART